MPLQSAARRGGGRWVGGQGGDGGVVEGGEKGGLPIAAVTDLRDG